MPGTSSMEAVLPRRPGPQPHLPLHGVAVGADEAGGGQVVEVGGGGDPRPRRRHQSLGDQLLGRAVGVDETVERRQLGRGQRVAVGVERAGDGGEVGPGPQPVVGRLQLAGIVPDRGGKVHDHVGRIGARLGEEGRQGGVALGGAAARRGRHVPAEPRRLEAQGEQREAPQGEHPDRQRPHRPAHQSGGHPAPGPVRRPGLGPVLVGQNTARPKMARSAGRSVRPASSMTAIPMASGRPRS